MNPGASQFIDPTDQAIAHVGLHWRSVRMVVGKRGRLRRVQSRAERQAEDGWPAARA
jgi:hypothetical protein